MISHMKSRNTNNHNYVRFMLPRNSWIYLDATAIQTDKDYYTTINAGKKTSRSLYKIAKRNITTQIAKEVGGINPRYLSIDTHDFDYKIQNKEGEWI